MASGRLGSIPQQTDYYLKIIYLLDSSVGEEFPEKRGKILAFSRQSEELNLHPGKGYHPLRSSGTLSHAQSALAQSEKDKFLDTRKAFRNMRFENPHLYVQATIGSKTYDFSKIIGSYYLHFIRTASGGTKFHLHIHLPWVPRSTPPTVIVICRLRGHTPPLNKKARQMPGFFNIGLVNWTNRLRFPLLRML